MNINIQTNKFDSDFACVLEIIQQHRTQAARAINHASILTAWHVGAYVSEKIKNAQWGAKVVQQLAEYIHTQDPTLKGWSKRSIYRMIQFYDLYSSKPFIERANTLKILPNPSQLVQTESTQMSDTLIVSPMAAQYAQYEPYNDFPIRRSTEGRKCITTKFRRIYSFFG